MNPFVKIEKLKENIRELEFMLKEAKREIKHLKKCKPKLHVLMVDPYDLT